MHECQYWLKIANFSYPLSFSALVRGDPFRIYGKALWFLKLVFQTANGENLVTLACIVFDWSTHMTNRQMDRWTELRRLRCATAVAAVAHKNWSFWREWSSVHSQVKRHDELQIWNILPKRPWAVKFCKLANEIWQNFPPKTVGGPSNQWVKCSEILTTTNSRHLMIYNTIQPIITAV